MTFRWFRFYNDAVNDPKVQRLPPEIFKLWINVLCLASANAGRIPDLVDTAFSLRMAEKDAESGMSVLENSGLVDRDEFGLKPHNWDARQFKSDSSTERVKRFRSVSKAVTETGPDQTQTRTESERKRKISGFVVGKKNGFGNGYTIQDPDERLNRFKKTLAEAIGRDGYMVVGQASDPENPLYGRSLALCKDVAKKLGKGWPHQW